MHVQLEEVIFHEIKRTEKAMQNMNLRENTDSTHIQRDSIRTKAGSIGATGLVLEGFQIKRETP
jgi:hypothetical protein